MRNYENDTGMKSANLCNLLYINVKEIILKWSVSFNSVGYYDWGDRHRVAGTYKYVKVLLNLLQASTLYVLFRFIHAFVKYVFIGRRPSAIYCRCEQRWSSTAKEINWNWYKSQSFNYIFMTYSVLIHGTTELLASWAIHLHFVYNLFKHVGLRTSHEIAPLTCSATEIKLIYPQLTKVNETWRMRDPRTTFFF